MRLREIVFLAGALIGSILGVEALLVALSISMVWNFAQPTGERLEPSFTKVRLLTVASIGVIIIVFYAAPSTSIFNTNPIDVSALHAGYVELLGVTENNPSTSTVYWVSFVCRLTFTLFLFLPTLHNFCVEANSIEYLQRSTKSKLIWKLFFPLMLTMSCLGYVWMISMGTQVEKEKLEIHTLTVLLAFLSLLSAHYFLGKCVLLLCATKKTKISASK